MENDETRHLHLRTVDQGKSVQAGRSRAAKQAVVLFDVDDTLYPELDYVQSGITQALSDLGFGSWTKPFRAAVLDRFREGQRSLLMQDAFADVGLPADEAMIAAFLAAYRQHTPTIALSETVRGALDKLKIAGLSLAAVSDGDAERQRKKVHALGLDRWFEHILLTGALGAGIDKSSPLPFELLQEHFGRDRLFIFVADNPRKDFIHPLRLGWPSIHIRRDNGVYADPFAEGTLGVSSEEEMFRCIFRLAGLPQL